MNDKNSSDRLDPAQLRLSQLRGSPRQYWRSVEELVDSAEVRQLIEHHFPDYPAAVDEAVIRRDFLKLMGASLALAGVTGCTRPPEEKIVPYVKAPEEVVPGQPLYYATALTLGGYALGVLVESHMGRPTKVEGNPDHPGSLGATDAFAQASILSLYDPDRSQTIVHRGVIETWDRFITTLTSTAAVAGTRRGAGVRILTQNVTSPTLAWQLRKFLDLFPEARWHQYEPAGLENLHQGARLAFGRPVDVVCDFTKADVVLSLDADFLHGQPGSVRYARDFIDRRRLSGGVPGASHPVPPPATHGWVAGAERHREAPEAGASPTTLRVVPAPPPATPAQLATRRSMNRLFVVESTPTNTGAVADHRLPLRPAKMPLLARILVSRLGGPSTSQESTIAEVPSHWLNAMVADLNANRGASLVVAGAGQPPVVHALVHFLNHLLGNVGKTLHYIEPVIADAADNRASLAELVADMRASRVEMLVILGGNPAYTAPGELHFGEALSMVPQRIHLSEYYDETSALCDWHIPAAHELESWSDARAFDGTATILQPLIAPLYAGKTAHEVLSVLSGDAGRNSYEIVQSYWRSQFGDEAFLGKWRRALHDGIVAESRSQTIDPTVVFEMESADESLSRVTAEQRSAEQLDIEFRPDPTVWDGRFSNNGWLQELPKPLTKITWENVAMVSPSTAARLAISSGDVVAISTDQGVIRAPTWIMPGQADGCVSLTFGYGRSRSGRIGNSIGYDAFSIRPNQAKWFGKGTIVGTGQRQQLAATQNHHTMQGNDILHVTTLERFQQSGEQRQSDHTEELPGFYPDHPSPGNAWGMVIDQTACIGCNACVVACQAENNVPIVGKSQVQKSREMHWLRIDRYYFGELDNPETYFQPMMCVHCENAPCEVVCPVAATVHDAEGTSNMIYNRCVGTRYCSNNCPYKVRRFNYLQFSDETTASFMLMRNPDVSVRGRGVMEKCSYCIQRINAARIQAKKENRPIEDQEVLTACQQACPTRAIVFGNLNDSQAEVRTWKQSPLNYSVLGELNTKPRTTYLARVVNTHPDLPEPQAVSGQHAPEPFARTKGAAP